MPILLVAVQSSYGFPATLGVPLKVTIISAAQGVDGIAFLAGMYGSAPKQKLAGKFLEVFPGGNLRGKVLGRFPELWQKMSQVLSIPISAAECFHVKKCWKGAIATCFCVQHVVLFV